ncbi:4Fe-4S binding protein [Thiogranum longum]|uniref:4Fe-4S binding protein n=1 Tax=Thiogranum longum TaxID=1537524 RepID=A0A4R1HBN5_9GAMM|nr:4Fe-4S binding protein [Thiogranum longum]TCK17590.1 4Fe-4S binding protein [Thiogranum longum]
MNRTQRQRLFWRSAFFALFVLAPPLDLFRLDLYQGHFIFLGMPWTLGVHDAGTVQASVNLVLRVFVPLLTLIGFGLWLSWRYGRLYCGWLCPHFSVVEAINSLMRRASGKVTLWQREPLPEVQRDGTEIHPRKTAWVAVMLAIAGFSLLWAVTFLTYLLPPDEVWGNLVRGELTRNQFIFITAATLLLTIEFSFARHLFCRYGCAVGLFQSLVWMANHKALVVGFNRARAADCASCDASCEHACPMRLQPRQIKRKMFTCTQCQQCVQACERVNLPKGKPGLLTMLDGQCALDVSERDFGRRPDVPASCFPKVPTDGG